MDESSITPGEYLLLNLHADNLRHIFQMHVFERNRLLLWGTSHKKVHLLPAQQVVIIIQNPEDRIALNVRQHLLIQMGRAKLSHQPPLIKQIIQ